MWALLPRPTGRMHGSAAAGMPPAPLPLPVALPRPAGGRLEANRALLWPVIPAPLLLLLQSTSAACAPLLVQLLAGAA